MATELAIRNSHVLQLIADDKITIVAPVILAMAAMIKYGKNMSDKQRQQIREYLNKLSIDFVNFSSFYSFEENKKRASKIFLQLHNKENFSYILGSTLKSLTLSKSRLPNTVAELYLEYDDIFASEKWYQKIRPVLFIADTVETLSNGSVPRLIEENQEKKIISKL